MASDLDRLLERGESLCGEHRKVWPECASLHPEVSGDLPEGQQSRSDLETRLRLELGRAFVQDFAEDEDCLTEWYPCEPSCGRCACSGQPYLSEKAWAAIGPVIAAEVARVRADVAGEIIDLLRDGQRYMAWRRQQQSGLSYGTSDVVFAAEYVAAVMQDRIGAPAESVVGAPTPAARHPEDDCHRCGRSLAIPWAAPSPLWNAVMRGGSINGEELFDGIVCPTCFAQLAQDRGIAEVWHFDAARVLVPLETVTPSGRVWDERAWLWREPVGAPTPISAPSDLAAPRDGISDQDFADLRADIAEARGVPLSSGCRRGDCRSCDFGSIHAPCEHDCHVAVGALPEDEGTRQEGLINVEE